MLQCPREASFSNEKGRDKRIHTNKRRGQYLDYEEACANCMKRQYGLVIRGTGIWVGHERVPFFGGELQQGGYKEEGKLRRKNVSVGQRYG
jgi:hypothetical protein